MACIYVIPRVLLDGTRPAFVSKLKGESKDEFNVFTADLNRTVFHDSANLPNGGQPAA